MNKEKQKINFFKKIYRRYFQALLIFALSLAIYFNIFLLRKKNSYKNKVELVQIEKEKLKNNYDSVKNLYNTTQTQLENLQSQVKRLNNQVQNMTIKYNNCLSQNRELKNDFNELGKNILYLNNKYSSIVNKFINKKAQHTN